ncbi:hypothetical protein GN958_ATG08190 [Phytophthora infestans]|uniref:Uncharacterized protein n=1 Tax=Phytophthora infestans TaxID=4787 RepID=A0A8S9UWW5_PHYIN|nr:hypothetical protein GN958_ATG08190 [Phytophthora infestans]
MVVTGGAYVVSEDGNESAVIALMAAIEDAYAASGDGSGSAAIVVIVLTVIVLTVIEDANAVPGSTSQQKLIRRDVTSPLSFCTSEAQDHVDSVRSL